jgi:hypothetical protein
MFFKRKKKHDKMKGIMQSNDLKKQTKKNIYI